MLKQAVIRVLCYFIPVAMNMLVGGVMFICSYRFAAAKCDGFITAMPIALWGVVTMAGTVIVSRLVKPENSLRYILGAGLMMVVSSLGFIIFDGLYTQFFWVTLNGCGQALFCMPFQLFAKRVESSGKSGGVVRATAFYTFSWSIGFASGSLFFANVREVGFFICLTLSLLVALSAAALAAVTRDLPVNSGNESAGETATAAISIDRNQQYLRSIFAVMGWLIGGGGTIVASVFRSMLSVHGTGADIPQMHLAFVTALACYVQAVTALLLCRSRMWMFKRLPVVLFSLAGIAGMTLLVIGREPLTFYAGSVIYGVYSGCIYFYLVFHSLAHPTRAKFFVAGNEVIVGVTSMTAPLIGGLLADKFDSGAPFIFAAAVILTAGLIQFVSVTWSKRACGTVETESGK